MVVVVRKALVLAAFVCLGSRVLAQDSAYKARAHAQIQIEKRIEARRHQSAFPPGRQ